MAAGDAGHADGAAAIRVRLDELLSGRGMTLTELSAQVDVSVVNLSILKNGRARAIRFSTMAKLCEALRCQPGDLLSYKPVSDRGAAATAVKAMVCVHQDGSSPRAGNASISREPHTTRDAHSMSGSSRFPVHTWGGNRGAPG